MAKVNIYDLEKSYDIVYTDPPWQQTKGGKRNVRPNQGQKLDYPTLSIDNIKTHMDLVIKHCSEKHNIFMWTIDKYLHKTEQMMNDLGYQLHARLIWDKENGIAPAFTLRFSHEYLLWFYKKGNILMPAEEVRGKYTTVLREPSTKHSKKPECAYEMIEKMFPDSIKLEMYARECRDGWDSWGNEI